MRTLRLSLVGTVILVLLGGLGVVAVQAEDEPVTATHVTGKVTGWRPGVWGPFTETPGYGYERGTSWEVDIEWSDARLPGVVRTNVNQNWHKGEGEDVGIIASAYTHRLEGPDGAWVATEYGLREQTDPEAARSLLLLTGEGGYEGMSAMLFGTTVANADGAEETSYEGYIFTDALPPMPEPLELTSEPVEEPGETTAIDTVGEPADDGARIVEVERLDDRMVDLTIDSPAVGTQQARLLLPADFDPDGDADWPVLYLLQGCCDTYDSWTRETDVEELTEPTDLLVVMPAATRVGDSGFGWYTDWYNGGEGGQPAWETFHLTELRQLLERNWQAGDDRVIAGLSMGGHGAMTYAARHPDMFKAAASFSGTLHTLEFDADPRVWGSKTEQADIWAAHDAVSLAPALAGLPLYVSYGTGEFGPLDEDEDPESADIEAWLYPHNEAFVARLEELAIPATVHVGPGTHTWPYWERGLHEAMPMLLEAVGL